MGEDARFIARRLVILASEDVGATPLALVVADAAARAVEFVGLPEAQLNLAQAVVHLASAPKSNRVTVALGRARRDCARAPGVTSPATCATPTTAVRPSIGHGEGYVYPHDRPDAFVDQQAINQLGNGYRQQGMYRGRFGRTAHAPGTTSCNRSMPNCRTTSAACESPAAGNYAAAFFWSPRASNSKSSSVVCTSPNWP